MKRYVTLQNRDLGRTLPTDVSKSQFNQFYNNYGHFEDNFIAKIRKQTYKIVANSAQANLQKKDNRNTVGKKYRAMNLVITVITHNYVGMSWTLN